MKNVADFRDLICIRIFVLIFQHFLVEPKSLYTKYFKSKRNVEQSNIYK